MSQPGETLTTPSRPPPREKRPRDDGDSISRDEAPAEKRRVAAADVDILFRIVVPSRQIGKVIGRMGHRIQKIREDTKATIKIADAISRHEERVIIISSKFNDETISDAEKALHLIATLILQDDASSEAEKVGTVHVAANTIRLLISGCQAGGLIGVSGQNIENLRISSGATITVLAQSQLPLCASAYESDRVVQISGEVPTVMKALEEIGSILRDNPPKQVIALSPSYKVGLNMPSQPYVNPSSGYYIMFNQDICTINHQLPSAALSNLNLFPNDIVFRTPNLAADYMTVALAVSEGTMGGLIGRGGSNISRIRNESGATIKVHGGKGEQKQRQIHIAGTVQQVALAKQRVDEYLYSQFIQQAGPPTPPLIGPTSGIMNTVAALYTTSTQQPTNQVPAFPGFPYYHARPM